MKNQVRPRFLKAASFRIQRIMLLVLLVLSITTPTFLAQQVEVVFAKSAQTTNAQFLLQQGIKLYEAQQFSEAITVWQQAVSTFAQQGDNLTQALVLSNLSSAYQELGQWSAAEDTIAKSFNLLQNLKDLAPSQTYWEIQAKALNTQGSLEWAKGNLEEALATWKRTRY